MLTWDELGEVSESGTECGAHGWHTHRQLGMLALSIVSEEILRSIGAARTAGGLRMRELGQVVDDLQQIAVREEPSVRGGAPDPNTDLPLADIAADVIG